MTDTLFDTPPPPPPAVEEVPVEFRGKGSEYFRIWIVNTALTLLTLGIFSAWAKVRSRRYFYGNTRIQGDAFDYVANPIAILKGRLVAAAMLLALGLSSQFFVYLYPVLLFIIFLLTPWLVVLAYRFNARVSTFRNVRFQFRGTVGDSYFVFFWLMLLIPFSLGLLLPFQQTRAREYLFNGHRYGNEEFSTRVEMSRAYGVYFGAFVIGFVMMIVIMGLMFATFVGMEIPEGDTADSIEFLRVYIPMYAIALLFGLAINSQIQAGMTNLLFNSGRLSGRVEFRSTLRARTLFWITVKYGLLTLVTLGLAWPWLRVRLAAYRASCTTLLLRGSLDDVVDDLTDGGSAVADQVGEALDLDVGLDFGF